MQPQNQRNVFNVIDDRAFSNEFMDSYDDSFSKNKGGKRNGNTKEMKELNNSQNHGKKVGTGVGKGGPGDKDKDCVIF
jgi:hypothetical protein